MIYIQIVPIALLADTAVVEHISPPVAAAVVVVVTITAKGSTD